MKYLESAQTERGEREKYYNIQSFFNAERNFKKRKILLQTTKERKERKEEGESK
jgi:hypothetical protein